MPVGGTVHVFLEGPGTAGAATGLVFSRVPVVGVHGVVGGVGLVNDLQLDVEVSGLTVEGVHAGVGHGHVDGSCSFTNQAKEAVGGGDLEVRDREVFVVHFNDGQRIVLSSPSEVVAPATEVVVGVTNHEVGGRAWTALELTDGHSGRAASCRVGQRAHVSAVAVGKGDLDGGGEVEEETRGASTCRVGGVLLVSDGGVHEVGLAVAVKISDLNGPRNVRAEVGELRAPEGALCRGLLVAHVFEVAVHDRNRIDVAVASDVSDRERFGEVNAHVDDVGVGLVGTVGIGRRVVLELTVVLDDGDVVVVAGVGDLTGGVVKTLAAQQENVVVRAGSGQSALGFAVIANLNHPVGVGLRGTE